MPELKRNILNFGYGVNLKYGGMFSHSSERFYMVEKFELPRVEDLKLTVIEFDSKCTYLARNDTKNSYFPKPLVYCLKIVSHVQFDKKQIEYYNHAAYELLKNEIGLILPTFPKEKRSKRGAILASELGGTASSIIGLDYEGISSFLHHKRHNALHKAVKVMERKTDLQHNRIHHLEDTTIMYGVYHSDTLTELIDTVHRMHNTTTWREKNLCRKVKSMARTVFTSRRCKLLHHKFNTFPNFDQREVCENV